MNSGRFGKGYTPWNKGKKGLHLSPKSEFKEGGIPWNKDKEGGVKNVGGYVGIRIKGKYRKEHRMLVSAFLGRELKKEESVHHLNEDKEDNNLYNLMAFASESAHKRFESGKPVSKSEIIFDGRNYLK